MSTDSISHDSGYYNVLLPELLQGYKLMHITFKVSMIGLSMTLHRTVHEVNKQPPHRIATHMAKP